MINITITILILYRTTVHQTYNEMTEMNKQPLISESVVVTRIGIHPTGKEPDQHIIRMAPGVSCTTTVREVPTKSKSGLCSRDEVLAPSNARPDSHSGLPHSPSNKLPRSREGQFDKVVTGLLGLSGPIKLDMWSVQIKACHWSQNDRSLIDTDVGNHIGTLG
jgi:hypothetical protein